MPHSDHHYPTSKHCHHGQKHHRPKDKNRDQPDGWSGKVEMESKVMTGPQKPTPMPQMRLWSKWLPGDAERSWFWQARQGANGKWEYQFTKDFSTIYQEEQPRAQPISYRMSMLPVTNVVVGNSYPQPTEGITPLTLRQQAPAPGNARILPTVDVVSAETVVSATSMDASTVEPVPTQDAPPSKTRKGHKHSHQKPHKHSKKISSVVKADKKVKFDSQSIVENWQVDWSEEASS